MSIRKYLTVLLLGLLIPVAVFSQDDLEPKAVEIEEVLASSTLEAKYSANNIASYTYESWVEGSSGDGSGEWIELFFSEPTPINGITIKNGFGNLAYYWKNNRVKKATIIFDDDEYTKTQIELPDTPVAQYIYFGFLDNTYSKMRLTIDEVYPGSFEDNDCCIDEICINAFIDRERIYGGYYDIPERSFLYDPETKRMLRGLYEIDVGEDKIKEDDNGFLLVEESDWEMGDTYWVQVNASLRGRMIHGFWPGTGGGHESNQYKIYLNPNGRHLLFTWHEEFYGRVEYYDPEVRLYVWENQTWKESDDWDEEGLEPVRDLKSLLENRNLVFSFDISNDYDYSDCMTITAYFKNDPYFSVDFDFTEENCVFSDYEETIWTLAAFGSPDDFANNPEFLADLQNYSETYENPLTFAAAFNPDPKMAEYLIGQGMSLTTEEEDYKRTYSALEAWNFGSNNDQVRDVLLKHGASYSENMLCDCMDKDDRESFKEIEPFIKSYEMVLEKLTDEISSSDTEKIEFYFNELIKLGIDIGTKPISQAIEALDMEKTKFFLSLGFEIPQYLDTYDQEAPLEYLALQYCQYAEYSDEEYDDDWKDRWAFTAQKAFDLMNFLFDLGISADECDGSGENILNTIADYGDYITKYHVEMAKLFISKGADVNRVGNYGRHPLFEFLQESNDNPRYWSEEQKEFKRLLLANGAYPEYGLLALFRNNTPDELLKSGTYLNKAFQEYFSKSTGRNVIFAYNSVVDPVDEKSLIIWLLEDYWGGKEYRYDDMIMKLLDANFSMDGFVLYNGPVDPIEYYMDDLKDSQYDEKSISIINKMFNKRKDQTNPSQIMYNFIKNALGWWWSIEDSLIQTVKILLDNGADWTYSQIDEDFDNQEINCAELLLHPGNREIFQSSADVYLELAKLLIEKGAGTVLTDEALCKAKIPVKIRKEIYRILKKEE